MFPGPIRETIVRFLPYYIKQRRRILHETDLLLDVGANTGQYARGARALGYSGRIVSFEPIKKAYNTLYKNARGDSKWRTERIAIGSEEGKKSINVSSNLMSSSIFSMSESYKNEEGGSIFTHAEEIKVKKLDNIFSEIYNEGDRVLLKMDTQGYEKKIIDGGKNSINRIEFIESEVALRKLHKGEVTVDKILDLIYANGFRMIALREFYEDKDGYPRQADAIFRRFK